MVRKKLNLKQLEKQRVVQVNDLDVIDIKDEDGQESENRKRYNFLYEDKMDKNEKGNVEKRTPVKYPEGWQTYPTKSLMTSHFRQLLFRQSLVIKIILSLKPPKGNYVLVT
ncbi:hypothetical protein BpHYR1_028320 [Brachionus plicatilis]|uniref:Uncharacterized protein n=1 Tax=Brachionus plicatilis TaxID=10195 RepID=A0A3M7R3K3_BRAPC|nr:hypothetical protein BpHYR1_028320 [Brachionus plicatilis]